MHLLPRGLAFVLGLVAVAGLYLWVAPADAPQSRLAEPPVVQPSPTPPSTAPADSQRAPDFTRPMMDGGTFRLSDYRGEVVVLNFWATWCSPCRQEIPDFVKMQRELGDDGVQFVGVALDREGFEAVRPFAEEMGINYPIVMDDGRLARQYGGVPTVPTTFVIGPDGVVEGYAPGMITEALLRPELEKLIEAIN